MDLVMKVVMKIIKNKVTVNLYGLINLLSQDNLKTMSYRVEEFIYGTMVVNTKVSG